METNRGVPRAELNVRGDRYPHRMELGKVATAQAESVFGTGR